MKTVWRPARCQAVFSFVQQSSLPQSPLVSGQGLLFNRFSLRLFFLPGAAISAARWGSGFRLPNPGWCQKGHQGCHTLKRANGLRDAWSTSVTGDINLVSVGRGIRSWLWGVVDEGVWGSEGVVQVRVWQLDKFCVTKQRVSMG